MTERSDQNGGGTSGGPSQEFADAVQSAAAASGTKTADAASEGNWAAQLIALRNNTTPVTGVTFTGSSQAAAATADWTIGFTTSATGALNAGKTITVVFNPGFTVPASPTIVLNSGFTSCTATGSAVGQTVTITLAGASCALANSTAATLTINGLTNPTLAGSLAANTFSVKTSVDATVVHPASPIVITAGTATKLAIISVNGGANPTAGTPFDVVVQAQDAGGNVATVTSDTDFELSLTTGTGILLRRSRPGRSSTGPARSPSPA